MSHRALVRILLCVGMLGAVAPSRGAAQQPLRPGGLWARASFGMSHVEQSCDTCQFSGTGTASMFNLTGGYAWSRVAFGFELGSINIQGNTGDISLTLFTAAWYPSARSGAFIKAAAGSSRFSGSRDADGVLAESGNGFAGQFEVGIDLSMGKVGATPVAIFEYAHQATTSAGALLTSGRNLSQWAIGFGIGLTLF